MASIKPDERFGEFWDLVTEQLEGLKPSTKKIFWSCFQEVYGELLTAKKSRGGKSKGKTFSGWNGFMAEKMQEVKKDESIEPCDRLRVIADMWNELGEEGKAGWCDENGYPAPKSPGKKSPGKKSPAKKSQGKNQASDEEDVEDEVPKKKLLAKKPSPDDEEAVAPKKKVLIQKKPSPDEDEDEDEETKAPKKPATKKKTATKKKVSPDDEAVETPKKKGAQPLGKPKRKTPVKNVPTPPPKGEDTEEEIHDAVETEPAPLEENNDSTLVEGGSPVEKRLIK